MIITPLPIIMNSEPDCCPNCHKVENVKRVCCECGHEYADDDEEVSALAALIGIFMIIAFVWLIITLIQWLLGFDNKSLVEVILDQVAWFRSRRIW